jgi:hypothetical protein
LGKSQPSKISTPVGRPSVVYASLMGLDDFMVRPGSLADELLHRLDIAFCQGLRHGFNRFALDLQHLTFQIFQGLETLLLPAKQVGKVPMVDYELLLQAAHLSRGDVQARFAPRGR